MHEATIANSILTIVQANVNNLDCSVVEVQVSVGRFRNIDPESLSFAYNELKLDYPKLLQSTIVVRIVEALALCKGNAHQYAPEIGLAFACPICGSGMGSLLQGEELEITNYEVYMADKQEEEQNA